MWTARTETLSSDNLRITIESGSAPMSRLAVLDAWREDADFRKFFTSMLAGTSFRAFRWEMPAVTSATLDRGFECVVLNSPSLDVSPDTTAFAEQFANASNQEVVTFQNLGGDAMLVVPCPRGPMNAYCHLASFLRLAPDAQKSALWIAVGAAMEKRISAKPVWLSTAGAGVAWLHVRLGDRPKYYGYAPYRATPNRVTLP
jgi:hypothetical protein